MSSFTLSTSLRRVGATAAAMLAPVVAFAQEAAPAAAATPVPDKADTTFMFLSTLLVLFMLIPGLALFYGGLVRAKNMLSVLMQCTVIGAAMMIVWVVYGYSFAFGGSTSAYFGGFAKLFLAGVTVDSTSATFSDGVVIPEYLFMLFQMTFAAITPALIVGAFAERIKFSAAILFAILWATFVYFPIAHMVWDANGLLFGMGALDFAGGTVVHINAGVAGLVGAFMVGKRTGYGRDMMAPHSMTLTLVGAAMLWFGWFGFNAGSALAASPTAVLAFATTNTASAAAMMAWVFIDWVRGMKPSAMGACIGAVVGLVAITPAAGFVSIAASIVIGVVAAGASNMALYWKSRSSIDDTLDVLPCHGVGGMAGMVLTAVFARDGGLITGSPVLFMKHLAALCLVSAFTFGGSWLLYKLVDLITPLRVDEHHEQLGLDLSQHGESLSLFDYDEARS
jgi:Amt family ammonium transporter